jgi:hypothetical protein
MDAARRLERETYRRGDGRHGGDLRPSGITVLWTILYRGLSHIGVFDPALSQIANEARLAISTVQAAIGRLEAAGIMGHVRRGVAVAGRWVQWTNAYLFASPEAWNSDTGYRSALVSVVKKGALEGSEPAPGRLLTPAELLALEQKYGLAGPKDPADGGNPA